MAARGHGGSVHRSSPEDPVRIHAFRSALDALDWDRAHVAASLSALFAAVDDLAEAEVRYYHRRRRTRALVSGVTRIAAWLLGTVGLLLPLLAGAEIAAFGAWSPYGYVFLAAAASCLAANALFGGTEGHIRFVSAQLELERLITAARIDWCAWRAGPADEEAVARGFALIRDYAEKLHAATIAETGRWGETLSVELAKYQATLAAAAKPGRK